MGLAHKLALAVFITLAAHGQSVQILSDSSQLLVGRTLKFSAVVRDAAGNAVPNAAVVWTTNNNVMASIDSAGLLTAKTLGTVRVQARAGTATGEAAVQTIPSRVVIAPDRATLDVSAQQRFSANAMDADGKPIPGVIFSWSVLNNRLGTSQVARIDANGMVSAVSEGGAVVYATFNYGDVQTGLQRQWIVNAPVEVSVPKSYQLKRLFNSERDRRTSWELRAKPTMLWPGDDGTLLFNASLGGLANGLVAIDPSGKLNLVSTAAESRFALSSYTTEFRTHSLTRQGNLLTYEDTNINGAQINFGNKSGVVNHISNNTPILPGTEATSGLVLTRNSYNDSGYVLLRANFRYENNPTGYTGLFLGNSGRYEDILLSTKDAVDGLTGTISVDGDFGVDGKGTAVYSATAGAGRIFFKQPHGEPRQKLLGIGDALLGSTVRSFNGGRGNHPTFWVDEDGTVLLCVTLNNNNLYYLRFLPNGKLESLQMSGQSGILWHHPKHGTLFHGNPFNNKGNGIWLWPAGADPKAVMLYSRDKFDGETPQDVESGALNALGEIYAYVRTDKTNMMLVQLGLDKPRTILKSGDTVELDAPINMVSFIGGSRSGPPHVFTGGSSGSIVEWTENAKFAILPYGERLFANNTMWFGGFHGSTWNVRHSPHGEIFFINGSGIAKINGDYKAELVKAFPVRVGTLTVNNPSWVDVNSNGDMLFGSSTSNGDTRFYILPSGAADPKEILVYSTTLPSATTLDGRIASSFDSFAFTDDGRVLMSLRFRNVAVPILYLYDGNTWKELAVPSVTRVAPHTITGISNLHRAGGNRVFATLNTPSGNILCEWTTAGWQLVINVSTVMPSGQVSTTVVNQEANRNGDLLFQHSNGGNNFLVVRRGNKMYQVVNLFRPTPDGDYLTRINAIDFRDDGTVYFLAVNTFDEIVLYQATPLF